MLTKDKVTQCILSCIIHGLQHRPMLNTLKLIFNYNKSKCVAFGPICKLDVSDMYLNASTINSCYTIKYLGVTLLSSHII